LEEKIAELKTRLQNSEEETLSLKDHTKEMVEVVAKKSDKEQSVSKPKVLLIDTSNVGKIREEKLSTQFDTIKRIHSHWRTRWMK
jgi:hypothetical protein